MTTPSSISMERLSCSTICFRTFPLETALEAIASLGFQSVDIGTMPGFCPHFDFLHDSAEDEIAFIKTVRSSSLKVHTFTTHIGDFNEAGADREAFMEAGRRNIRVAAELGAFGINVNCGKYVDRLERSFYEDVRLVGAHISELAADAEKEGIKLLVEAPHKGKLIRTVLEAKLLLEVCDHPNVYLIFDVNHHHAAGWRPDDVIKAAGNRLLLVHLRDAVGRDNQYPLGTGEIDFPLLFRSLEASGYPGKFSFEFTDAADTVEGNCEVLRQSIEYLQNLTSGVE